MADLFWTNRLGLTWVDRLAQKWTGRIVAEPSKGEVIDLGLSRLAYQFKGSEKFNSFIEAFLSEYQELYDSELQLLNDRYLSTAEGVQLDSIGDIVGLPRPEESADVAGVFGFLNDSASLGFTTLSDTSVGGNFISIFASKTPINDELYRLLLRAKVIENRIAMTVEETLELISFMFGGVIVEYTVPTAFEPNYKIYKVLSSFEDNLLDSLPIMLGIGTVTFTSL